MREKKGVKPLDLKDHSDTVGSMMNRRVAIQTALTIATGLAILPRHLRSANGPSVSLTRMQVTADQEALLAEVVDALIPATATPGAKALNVHLFVLKMLDDCHSEKDQRLFIAGLDQVDQFARERQGKGFMTGDETERVALLEGMTQKQAGPPELGEFYRLMRSRTIQGYRESEYVMTEVMPHRMIPDPYDGYYPAKNYQEAL